MTNEQTAIILKGYERRLDAAISKAKEGLEPRIVKSNFLPDCDVYDSLEDFISLSSDLESDIVDLLVGED